MCERKEWTLMFYFASDNPLAPGIISQLKAIKQAGFHPEANVVAQFDPHPVGAPTHIFEVNVARKLRNPGNKQIGYIGRDPSYPFVSNLMEDKLWRQNQKNRFNTSIKEQFKGFIEASITGQLKEAFEAATKAGALGVTCADTPARAHKPPYEKVIYNPPEPPPYRSPANKYGAPKELSPMDSLRYFLEFCRTEYPAQHYILFILGHGMVVGNDVFLFDEHAEKPSLSLVELGCVLECFKRNIGSSQFELVSFHSCSVSSAEVACQLKGTANYMLASQGPAFVGSWPYRQILMRIFYEIDRLKDLREAGNALEHRNGIKKLLRRICRYCFQNSTDFLLAGYSFDICLCNLNKADDIMKSITGLSRVLINALHDPLIKELILLAHWRSQSYWQENYTDIKDFCLCLIGLCESLGEPPAQTQELLKNINNACRGVAIAFAKEDDKSGEKLIVEADFAGPTYQYSNGLSFLFPWSEPSDDATLLGEYGEYKDYKFAQTGWLTFLKEEYFKRTRRKTRRTEEVERRYKEREERGESLGRGIPVSVDDDMMTRPCREQLYEDLASLVYNDEGALSPDSALNPIKVNPPDPTGDSCDCLPIKNFPRDTRALQEKKGKAAPAESPMPISEVSYQV